MSEPYQMYVLVADGVSASAAIPAVYGVLRDEGATFEHSEMVLHDLPGEDREFEPVGDVAKALEEIANWPVFGAITFDIPEYAMLVCFHGCDGVVRCVEVSTPHTMRQLKPDAAARCRRIGQRLHAELSATRTVMDWGLWARGHGWEAELACAASGDASGTFEILDLPSR